MGRPRPPAGGPVRAPNRMWVPMKTRVLILAGIATVLTLSAFPVEGHHVSIVDNRLVQPSGVQVLVHIPVAAGYEPVPTPQHCLEGVPLVSTFYSQDFSGAHGYSFIGTPLASGVTNLWTTTSYAGVGTDTGHSAGNRLYYGSTATGHYDFGHTAGTAQSPAIAVPAGSGSAVLTFATKWQVEWLKGYDHLWVEALDTSTGRTHILCTANAYDRGDPAGLGGNTLVPSCSPFHANPCVDGAGIENQLVKWESRSVQLPSSFNGKTIHLRFTFDSADDKANPYNGWFVDDVKLGRAA